MAGPLLNLQALRGVACLLVVWFHVWHAEVAFRAETPVFREVRWFGFAGVDLFFALSGFVIFAAHAGDFGRPRAVPRFLFRRFWRVYPVYWAALVPSAAVAIGMMKLRLFGPGWEGWWASWLALAPGGPPNLIHGAAWTLTYEVLFYLVFAATLLLPWRAAVGVAVGWAGLVVSGRTGWADGNGFATAVTCPLVLEFLGGCLAAGLARAGWRGGGRVAAAGVGYAVAAAVAVATAAAEPWGVLMTRHPVRAAVWGPAAVLVVYGLATAELSGGVRLPRWLGTVGDASYAIYLFHVPALNAVMMYGWKLSHTGLPHFAWLAAALAACVGGGFLFHRWVERPLLALARRRRKPEPRPAAAPEPTRRAA